MRARDPPDRPRCCSRRRPAPRWSCPPDSPPRSTSAVKGSTARGRPPASHPARRSPSIRPGSSTWPATGGATRAARSRTSGRSIAFRSVAGELGKRGRGALPLRSAAAQSAGRRCSRGPRAARHDVRSRSQPGRALSHRGRSRRDGGRRHTRARHDPAPEAARGRGPRSRRQSVRGRPGAERGRAARPRGTPAQSPVALADSPASHRQPRRAVLGLERRRRRGAVAARHRRDLERGPGGPPASRCVGRSRTA